MVKMPNQLPSTYRKKDMVEVASQSERGRFAHTSTLSDRVARSSWLHGLALATAVFIAYFGLWSAYFTSDDFWMLGWVRHRPDLGEGLFAQFGYSLRPLLDLNLWLRVRLFDLDPAPYYWISLLQHICVTLLVYALASYWSRRRSVAFVTALLFGTSFTYFEVVTWITGSNYSLAAIPYLASLGLFSVFLDRRTWPWYVGALTLCAAALLLTELALSLPLVLSTYHLIMTRDRASRASLIRRDWRLHVPFWLLLTIYVVIQLGFARAGTSEAAVAGQAYRPGLHMLGNFQYLAYLVVPPYVPGALVSFVPLSLIQGALVLVAIAGGVLAAYVFWKRSPLARFGVAMIVVSFLPYTLWEGTFAGAIRYRYLPAIGFSLLLALLATHVHDYLRQTGKPLGSRIVPAAVAVLFLANVFFVQVWVQRHLENSVVRRALMTGLINGYPDVAAGTAIYMEVPEEKYSDLKDACTLLYRQPVLCQTFVSGGPMPVPPDTASAAPVLWVRVTADGLEQIRPPYGQIP